MASSTRSATEPNSSGPAPRPASACAVGGCSQIASPSNSRPPGRNRLRAARSRPRLPPQAWLTPTASTTSAGSPAQRVTSASTRRIRPASPRAAALARPRAIASASVSTPTQVAAGSVASTRSRSSAQPQPRSSTRAPASGASPAISSAARASDSGALKSRYVWPDGPVSVTPATLAAGRPDHDRISGAPDGTVPGGTVAGGAVAGGAVAGGAVAGGTVPGGPAAVAIAASRGPALACASTTSRSGSLPQVMPPPAHRCNRSPSAATVRMVNPRSSRSAVKSPRAPIEGPRPTGSSAAIWSSAASFGAPVTEPPGRTARSNSTSPVPGRSRADTTDSACHSPHHSRTANSSGTETEPVTATRDRSLRSRSTIIMCSARSLGSANSSARPTAVAGRVPLIGCVRATPPATVSRHSGEAVATVQPSPASPPPYVAPGSPATARSAAAASPAYGALRWPTTFTWYTSPRPIAARTAQTAAACSVSDQDRRHSPKDNAEQRAETYSGSLKVSNTTAARSGTAGHGDGGPGPTPAARAQAAAPMSNPTLYLEALEPAPAVRSMTGSP